MERSREPRTPVDCASGIQRQKQGFGESCDMTCDHPKSGFEITNSEHSCRIELRYTHKEKYKFSLERINFQKCDL